MAGGGNLLFLHDSVSGQKFLVDTGAALSIIPFRSANQPSGPELLGADGREIPAWGSRELKVIFGGHPFCFWFVCAAVKQAILGNDFLAALRLLVNPARRQVLDATTLQPLSSAAISNSSPLLAVLTTTPESVRTLVASYPQVFSAPAGRLPPPLHGVEHTVETTGQPVFAKARRLDHGLKDAKAEFAKLEAAGIVSRSNSRWSSPLHMVRKQDGTW